MSAPQTIAEIMAGPHIRTLIRDGATRIVMVEPLRVVPFVQKVRCETCGHVRASACSFTRCPLASDL